MVTWLQQSLLLTPEYCLSTAFLLLAPPIFLDELHFFFGATVCTARSPASFRASDAPSFASQRNPALFPIHDAQRAPGNAAGNESATTTLVAVLRDGALWVASAGHSRVLVVPRGCRTAAGVSPVPLMPSV